MTTYNLNPESAKQAEQFGARINTTGKYIGKFTLAEAVTSKGGTKGVEFSFRSDDGQSADYLTLWTTNTEGKELFGHKVLMAIMACLKIKTISVARREVEKYSREVGGKVKQTVEAFPDLMDKPIGLLLQVEPYEGYDGTMKSKMVIAVPFEASTGFTAGEILNRATKAETMERILSTLKDRPIQKRQGSVHSSGDAPALVVQDDFDDDIPF